MSLIVFSTTMAAPPALRVLVIDDDEMSRELMRMLVEAEGYAVDSAESGEAALALLDCGDGPRPHFVLADVQMPGMTTAQLAGRLRRACGRKTLLLAMSGSRPVEAAIAHFDGFLMKPFTMQEVAAALVAHGGGKTAQKPARQAKAKQSARTGFVAPRASVLDSLHASAAETASKGSMNAQGVHPSESVAPKTAGGVPVLDETIYRQLSGSMPAPQLHEMYAMCVNDARARIASMRSLADAHDSAQFIRQAHAIKGSCGMLGATELHRIATGLEKNGPEPAGPRESGVNSLDELSDACERLERMLGARA
jgi:CheY-like chemotaxis protein